MSIVYQNHLDFNLLIRIIVFLFLLIFAVVLVYFRQKINFEFYQCEAKFDLIKTQTDYLDRYSTISAQLLENNDWLEFWQNNITIGRE